MRCDQHPEYLRWFRFSSSQIKTFFWFQSSLTQRLTDTSFQPLLKIPYWFKYLVPDVVVCGRHLSGAMSRLRQNDLNPEKTPPTQRNPEMNSPEKRPVCHHASPGKTLKRPHVVFVILNISFKSDRDYCNL